MIRLESYAKINLFLEVGEKRPDGYHDIVTVMQTVSVVDEITIARATGVEVSTDDPSVPEGEKNLAFRAAQLLRERERIREGCSIRIRKRIPAAAGLGGGSSNAAAAVAGLCRLWDRPLPVGRLAELSASLGSDVPFFHYGGTCLCRGRGERITPLPPIPESTRILLVTPRTEVTSSFAYKELERLRLTRKSPLLKMVPVPDPGSDRGMVLRYLHNRLEEAVLPAYPLVKEAKGRASLHCRTGVLMSGSGPTLFGILSSDAADDAGLISSFDDSRFAAVVHPTSCGFRFLEGSEE